MIILVDIITSSAVFESSFKIRYTIWRKDGSLFWKSFEIAKNKVVASLVGNFSPVNRRTAILVRSVRHFRGEIGDELNNLAVTKSQDQCPQALQTFLNLQILVEFFAELTILKYRGTVKLHHHLIRILIFFAVTHCDCSAMRTAPSRPSASREIGVRCV